MAGLQVFSRDLCPKKGRHISRADLFLSFFNFHGILISVSLPLLIPASVLPDKPAVRCHAVRKHDSLCSVGNRIKVYHFPSIWTQPVFIPVLAST